jgi:hypothetical protein
LVVHVGETNQDLMIVANQPDGTLTAGANVLMIDDQGTLVENLRVEVTPFGGPSRTVHFVYPSKTTTYQCANHTCIDASTAKSRNKGMGDADNKDGSTGTDKRSTPPAQI